MARNNSGGHCKESEMDNAKDYVPSLYNGEMRVPKRTCQLTQDGAMSILAPRIAPVKSLEKFLNENINYI